MQHPAPERTSKREIPVPRGRGLGSRRRSRARIPPRFFSSAVGGPHACVGHPGGEQEGVSTSRRAPGRERRAYAGRGFVPPGSDPGRGGRARAKRLRVPFEGALCGRQPERWGSCPSAALRAGGDRHSSAPGIRSSRGYARKADALRSGHSSDQGSWAFGKDTALGGLAATDGRGFDREAPRGGTKAGLMQRIYPTGAMLTISIPRSSISGNRGRGVGRIRAWLCARPRALNASPLPAPPARPSSAPPSSTFPRDSSSRIHNSLPPLRPGPPRPRRCGRCARFPAESSPE